MVTYVQGQDIPSSNRCSYFAAKNRRFAISKDNPDSFGLVIYGNLTLNLPESTLRTIYLKFRSHLICLLYMQDWSVLYFVVYSTMASEILSSLVCRDTTQNPKISPKSIRI